MNKKEVILIFVSKIEKKYIAILLVLIGLCIETLTLFYPRILGQILDTITIQKDKMVFLLLCLMYVLNFTAEKTLIVVEELLRVRTKKDMEISVKKKILKNMLLSKELAEKEAGTGKTSEFLLEGAGYLFRYLEIGIHFIKNAVKIVFVLAILLYIDWRIFGGAVVLLPLFSFISYRSGRKVKGNADEKERAYQDFRNWTVGFLTGIETVKRFEIQEKVKQVTQKKEQIYMEKARFFSWAFLQSEFVVQMFMQFLNFFLYILSACLITQGRLTIGSYIMIFEYYYVMQGCIVQLSSLYREANEKSALMEQMAVFLRDTPEYGGPGGKKEGLDGRIACRNVSFCYPGKRRILENCSFCVESGEEAAIAAESGAGKSTLLKLIGGLYQAEDGEIFLGKYRAGEYNQEYLRSRVIYLVQEKVLLQDTVRENIVLGKRIAEERLWEALETAGLSETIRKLPQGLDTEIGGGISCLSEGEYQRLNLARVLLMKPCILMIDEGTISLDLKGERTIRSLMKKALPGVTILFVTHRKESMEGVKRILYLNKGKINEKKS